MAEDLANIVPEEDPAAEPTEAEIPPYQSRFQLLFGVLLGVAMAAVVATILVIAGGRHTGDPAAANWAPWHPDTSGGKNVVDQIADHVGSRYTLPTGHQLVLASGGPL